MTSSRTKGAGQRTAIPFGIRVAVCVDLERSARSGGQIRFWEKLARAAARSEPSFDLTVHVQGRRHEVAALAPHVRFVAHRPVLSTQWLGFSAERAARADVVENEPSWDDVLNEDVLPAWRQAMRRATRVARGHAAPCLDTPRPATTLGR